MKKLLSLVTLFVASLCIANESDSPLPFEIGESEGGRVSIVSPKWHEKDGAWLFTCRLEADAERLVKPVAHILFEGFGENDEEPAIWDHKYVTRRKFFDRNYGTKVGAFTRVLVKEIPVEVKKLKIKFVNRPPQKADS